MSLGGVLVLGAWHGLNPGMGWLFAVALGMQERDRRAVWRALPPLAIGHGIAIAAAVGVAAALGVVVPLAALEWGVGGALVAFGVWKLRSPRHPRYGGMRVNGRELTVWSTLMATAHGAGLMIVPFVLRGAGARGSGVEHALVGHAAHATMGATLPGMEGAVVATLVHTVGYLVVVGGLAVLVFERLGLSRLRRLWVNLDLIWAVALIVAGVATLGLRVLASVSG